MERQKSVQENSLYNRWKHIRERCTNPRRKDYKYYGAKGVTVCDEWRKYSSFRSWFLDAIMERASDRDASSCEESLVVDRIDPDKGYFPGNCRLVTAVENSRRSIKGCYNKGRFCLK